MPGPDQERLARILDDYLVAIEQGLPVSPEALLETYPDDAAQLRGYLSGLQLFHAAAGVAPAQVQDSMIGGVPESMRTMGDYQLVREIGRGGMGVVYEAWQISLRRRVALKILPFTAAHDAKHISRFKNEAQAAAQVQHPNIVPVYAIGEENGVHYYVMQLVDGQSLTSLLDGLRSSGKGTHGTTAPNYPDLTRFAVSARSDDGGDIEFRRNAATCAPMRAGETADHIRVVARLAHQAAEALHAAHEYGVVHRDVKPSNLLLDDQGKLWVTDFGLARCREDQAEQGCGRLTQTGDVLGTMRYMSPEQALGRAALIDQRTDIYSLGLTMYELATLHHPADEVSSVQVYFDRNRETPKPLRQWNRHIPRDFQTIVLKCVAEFPHERYSTAKELADDLQRFLSGQTIEASPPSLLSRAGKWAKRRRGMVFAASAVLIVAITAAIVNSIMLSHERNADNVRALAQSKKFLREKLESDPAQFADQLAAIPGAEGVRRAILERNIAFFQKYEKEAADDPALATDWALAQSKLGTLNEKLGNKQQALDAHAKALKVWQDRASRDPANLENIRNLALAQNNLGLAMGQQGKSAEAIDLLKKARDTQTKLLAADPGSIELATDLAATHGNFGLMLSESGAPNAAIEQFNEAIKIGIQLADRPETTETVLRSLAASYNNLGSLEDVTEPAAAAGAYQKAIYIQLKLVKSDKNNRIYQSDLARTYNNLGYLSSRTKDWKKAELSYGRAIEIQQNLVNALPNAAAYRHDLAISYNNLGMAQSRDGRWEKAESSFRQSMDFQNRLLADNAADVETRSNLGSAWNNLGMLFDRQRQFGKGEKAYRQAIVNQRGAFDGAQAKDRYRALLSQHYFNFARNLNSQAKHEVAMQVVLERKLLWSGNADRLYSVAQQFADTFAKMRIANVSQKSQAECQHAAVTTLREAIAAGLPRERLKDRSLASLTGNDEFNTLLDEKTVGVVTPSAEKTTVLSRSN
jgi:serine/threonine protein kinase